MQMNQQGSGGGGSFGMPPHMRAQIAAAEKAKQEGSAFPAAQEAPAKIADSGYLKDSEADLVNENVNEINLQEGALELEDPVKDLKDRYGIEITEEDIQRILFKGYTEKLVTVIPSVMGSEPLVAVFKTLTAREYEEADEKLAEELRDIRMTNDGFAARRGMWLLAYGLRKIQGKLYYQQKFTDDTKKELDRKATLVSRKEALVNFSPVVLSKMMEIQSGMTIAINFIFADVSGKYVKKS
jgi:hypothetical protein